MCKKKIPFFPVMRVYCCRPEEGAEEALKVNIWQLSSINDSVPNNVIIIKTTDRVSWHCLVGPRHPHSIMPGQPLLLLLSSPIFYVSIISVLSLYYLHCLCILSPLCLCIVNFDLKLLFFCSWSAIMWWFTCYYVVVIMWL